MSSYKFFPTRLDRTSAPEQCAPDAARMLLNLDVDIAGRLRRRKGSMTVSGPDDAGYNVNSAFFVPRGDGSGLLFDGDAGGTLRVTVNPEPNWTDQATAISAATANENFKEESE